LTGSAEKIRNEDLVVIWAGRLAAT
jgi:hypothetical protein